MNFPKHVARLLLSICMSNDNHILFSRSVNEVICHGIPDLRPLEDGDIVNGKNIKKRKL